MSALWIAHVTVTDDAAYKKYAELAGPAITSESPRSAILSDRMGHLFS